MSLTHTRVQRLAVLACMSALAFVLMLFEFPVIPVVSYLKMDFSDLPVLIATWLYGPVAGIIVAAIKCLLHGLMYGMWLASYWGFCPTCCRQCRSCCRLLGSFAGAREV